VKNNLEEKNEPKVALVCKRDTGGAGIACARLHLGLLAHGYSSRLLLQTGSEEYGQRAILPDFAQSPRGFSGFTRKVAQKALGHKLKKELSKIAVCRPSGLERLSLPRSGYNLLKAETVKNADIINLHWVGDVLDWPSFFRGIDKPVIWTLHDENPFSGVQHYEEPFLGMDERGFPLPRVQTVQERLWEQRYVQKKLGWLKNFKRLFIVSPSRWLMEKSMASPVFSHFPHFHIPNGVPEDIYRTLNRDQCRDFLGLPRKKFLLLFVAEETSNRRKGLEYLLKAINLLPTKIREDISLVSVGSFANSNAAANRYILGPIRDERLMTLAYNAADAFVIPSLVDNLPNTIIESQMCGTPVVGFPAGGIGEMIQEYSDGVLCENVSVAALVRGIQQVFEEGAKFDREALSNAASEKYATFKQAQAYMHLYHNIYNS